MNEQKQNNLQVRDAYLDAVIPAIMAAAAQTKTSAGSHPTLTAEELLRADCRNEYASRLSETALDIANVMLKWRQDDNGNLMRKWRQQGAQKDGKLNNSGAAGRKSKPIDKNPQPEILNQYMKTAVAGVIGAVVQIKPENGEPLTFSEDDCVCIDCRRKLAYQLGSAAYAIAASMFLWRKEDEETVFFYKGTPDEKPINLDAYDVYIKAVILPLISAAAQTEPKGGTLNLFQKLFVDKEHLRLNAYVLAEAAHMLAISMITGRASAEEMIGIDKDNTDENKQLLHWFDENFKAAMTTLLNRAARTLPRDETRLPLLNISAGGAERWECAYDLSKDAFGTVFPLLTSRISSNGTVRQTPVTVVPEINLSATRNGDVAANN